MPRPPSASEIRRRVQQAQRQGQRQAERELKKVVTDLTRKVDREVSAHNRQADAHNRRAIADLNRRLRSARPTSTVSYTVEEQQLAERVQAALVNHPDREIDLFVSYARIDGAEVAEQLFSSLEALGVSTWFDAASIEPGVSQALQMDRGLRAARAGVVVLTPAYLAGRFWTERELGALLHKPRLIPVLHNVTFDDVKEYSGILPDLAGFATSRDSISDIAEKIAGVILPPEVPALAP